MKRSAVAVGLACGACAAWLSSQAFVALFGELAFWGGARCTEMGCFTYAPAGVLVSLGAGAVATASAARATDEVFA